MFAWVCICDVKICPFHVFMGKASTRVPCSFNCMSHCNKMCVCVREGVSVCSLCMYQK